MITKPCRRNVASNVPDLTEGSRGVSLKYTLYSAQHSTSCFRNLTGNSLVLSPSPGCRPDQHIENALGWRGNFMASSGVKSITRGRARMARDSMVLWKAGRSWD